MACLKTRVALNEWLTDNVGNEMWAQSGKIEVYNRILTLILGFKDDAVDFLREWWSSA
jgi:hypothetical protein